MLRTWARPGLSVWLGGTCSHVGQHNEAKILSLWGSSVRYLFDLQERGFESGSHKRCKARKLSLIQVLICLMCRYLWGDSRLSPQAQINQRVWIKERGKEVIVLVLHC